MQPTIILQVWGEWQESRPFFTEEQAEEFGNVMMDLFEALHFRYQLRIEMFSVVHRMAFES